MKELCAPGGSETCYRQEEEIKIKVPDFDSYKLKTLMYQGIKASFFIYPTTVSPRTNSRIESRARKWESLKRKACYKANF